MKISIHAAREGGDIYDRRIVGCLIRFQSTPPVKAATSAIMTGYTLAAISIHAAREGGDSPCPRVKLPKLFISIHAAREGGDNIGHAFYYTIKDFNPRRP